MAIRVLKPVTQVRSSIRLDECEDLLSEISAGSVHSLALPRRLDGHGAFGLEALLITAITLLSRMSPKAVLRVPATDDEAIQHLQDLSQVAYGLVALALLRPTDAEGRPIPVHIVNAIVNRRLKDPDDPNLRVFAEEEGINVLSIYGHSDEFAFWPFSTTSTADEPALQSRAQVQVWLASRLQGVLPKEFHGRFEPTRLENVASATYELLENTVLHGRLEGSGAPIRTGVRGLTVRVIELAFQVTNIIGGGNQDVNYYFVQRSLRDVSEQRRFFEITVFDSGLGYFDWINAPCNKTRSPPDLLELSAGDLVRKCFLTHASSTGHDGSGVGLFRVMRLMRLMSGFVRVRTGRSALYARLDERPKRLARAKPSSDSLAPFIELEDWFPKRVLPNAPGTSVTLIVPLTTKTGK